MQSQALPLSGSPLVAEPIAPRPFPEPEELYDDEYEYVDPVLMDLERLYSQESFLMDIATTSWDSDQDEFLPAYPPWGRDMGWKAPAEAAETAEDRRAVWAMNHPEDLMRYVQEEPEEYHQDRQEMNRLRSLQQMAVSLGRSSY